MWMGEDIRKGEEHQHFFIIIFRKGRHKNRMNIRSPLLDQSSALDLKRVATL